MATGIRGRILTWLLIAIVPLLTVALLSSSLVEDRLGERVVAEMTNLRQLESDRINVEVARFEADADRLARATFVRLFTDQVQQARLEGFAGALPADGGFDPIDPNAEAPLNQVATAIRDAALGAGTSIVEARVVGADGVQLGASDGYSWEPRSADLIARVLAEGSAQFGSVFQTANGPRVGLVTPIRNSDEQVAGALLSEVAIDGLIQPLVAHHGFGDSSEAFLVAVDADGSPRFISPVRFPNEQLPGTPDADGVSARSLVSLDGFKADGLDYRGGTSVFSGETIERTGWGLVLRSDLDEAYDLSQGIRRLVLLGSLLAIAALLIGWAVLLRPLVNRIRNTADAADRVARGDFAPRIDDRHQDEVGDVARGIDRLAADLEFDIRMRADAERRLRYQATHDELTNIFNRQHMTAQLRKSLDADQDQSVTLLFIDLDDFKLVNDLWSHSIGDEVLVAVANRLRRLMGDEVLISRWGGDEFIVVLKNADPATVDALAQRVRALFVDPINTSVGPHPVACSVGIATAFSGDDLDQLLHDADAKMFEEKQSNRKSRMIEPETARLVETALTDGRIEVHYQPIVRMLSPSQTRLQAVEALARLRSTDGSLYLPADFLDEVLSHRYAREIDRAVATAAFNDLREWRQAGLLPVDFVLALNISPASMSDPDLANELCRAAETAGIDPSNVVLELLHEADDLAPDVWAELHAAGFGFAIDDLGLKRSNFDRLVGGGVGVAKLDRRWLDHPVVLDAMVRTCRDHGLTAIAVGVETMEQLATVHEHGIRMCQGFVIARPQPVDDLVKLLTHGRNR